MVSVIWSCPDCGADLDGNDWCADCDLIWSGAAITVDDPPEYRHPEDDDE